ncbi:MAG: hypothetical protein KGH79_04375 [Patescibacteria group bacterium]|nr:hypothetical protein [Patescibacteria group bacterium]
MGADADTVVGHRPTKVNPNPKLYWLLWFCGVAIVIIPLIIALVGWSYPLFDKFGMNFEGGPTAILFDLVFFALSLKEVPANKVAAAFCYGGALVILPSGLHFVPFLLMQIKDGPRPVQEFQCPGEPENVFKGDDKEPLPAGMVRPIRVVTGGPKTEGGKDGLLNERMTIVLNFVVQWAITDVLDYVSNYGSVAEVEKQVRDIGEALLAEVAVSHSAESFIDNLPKTNDHLVTKIGERFENSGVKIISTRLISPDVSHEVSKALAGIPEERAKAQQTVIKSEADKTRRTKEGEGTAAAEFALLDAQAKGRREIMKRLRVSGEAVLASEAVRGLSDKTDVLVAGAEGGMKDVMSIVKGAQGALQSGNGKEVQS